MEQAAAAIAFATPVSDVVLPPPVVSAIAATTTTRATTPEPAKAMSSIRLRRSGSDRPAEPRR